MRKSDSLKIAVAGIILVLGMFVILIVSHVRHNWLVNRAIEAIDNGYKVTVNAKILTNEEIEELTYYEIKSYSIDINDAKESVRLYN